MNSIKIQVKTNNQKYSIFIGKGLIYKIRKLLKENSINFNQCLIIIDKKVPKNIIKKILFLFPKKITTTHYFKANEKNKNQKSIDKICKIRWNDWKK